MSLPPGLDNERLLELFFSQSLDGFFFMMLDEPVEWSDAVDKDAVIDFVFDHQRMTKVNAAIVTQFKARSAEALLGMTPAQFFAHDLPRPRSAGGRSSIAAISTPRPTSGGSTARRCASRATTS